MIWSKGYYTIHIDRDLDKALKKLPQPLKTAFNKKIKFLSQDCKHPSLNFKPYAVSEGKKKELGVDDIYEFYINKSFRCLVYVLDTDKELILFYIGTHEQVKRKTENI